MLEGAIANLGNSGAMAITRPGKKVDKPIEGSGLLLPAGFKNPIRKEIHFRWKEQRNFQRRVTSMTEATDWRTAGS